MFFRRPAPALSDATWREVCDGFALTATLPGAQSRRLRELASRFLRLKSIEPVQGLELDEVARAGVAALACVPVLELGLAAYRGWRSLVVYPGGFLARGQEVDEAGVVHEFEEARSGEAWSRGPVILSFEDVVESGRCLDGYNVVIHEMAHKLDMQDGSANGRPPLHPDMNARLWHRAFSDAFEDLEARIESGRPTPVDGYAAHSPAECFAVMSEHFFELPEDLHAAYPEVFLQLSAYYRQDPRWPR